MKHKELFTKSSAQNTEVPPEMIDDLEVGIAIEEAKNMATLQLVVETFLRRLRTGQDVDDD